MANRLIHMSLLDARLLAKSIGGPTCLSLFICFSSALAVFGIHPVIKVRLDERAGSNISVLSEAVRLSEGPESRYTTFRNRLLAPDKKEEALRQIFVVAQNAEISLSQGEYQLVADSAGRFTRLQITLPIKGAYQRIRSFVESLLVELPALSLDEITFRRDTIKTQTVDAQLRLTLYLRDSD